jgi:uncharacterized phage protein (TIGR01671 family)
MREIEYRTWNVKEEEWEDDCLLNKYGDHLRWSEGGESLYDFDNVLIEEFTGLKDKNGNKIYEGDILKTIRAYRYMYNMGYIGEVRHRDHFADYEYGEMGGQLTQTKTDYCIIIGNIHENPELLDNVK